MDDAQCLPDEDGPDQSDVDEQPHKDPDTRFSTDGHDVVSADDEDPGDDHDQQRLEQGLAPLVLFQLGQAPWCH
jgi:hypothetical protein